MSISHHRISFEYYLKGGDDALNPIPPGNWPAPLAFYCSPTGIVIGKDAEGAARTRTPNAFTDYFGLLTSGLKYELGGEQKPLSKLLLDASETVFRSFYTEVLLTGSGTLEDNRLNMPLTVVCEADIKDNERAYISNTFKDSGYDRISVVKYEKYIDRYIKTTLSKQYTCDKVLVAWTEGTDMVLSLFDARGNSAPKSKILPNLGIDPRLNFVIDKLWDRCNGYCQWIEKDVASAAIEKAATDFLNSNVPVGKGVITLPDNIQIQYNINRIEIDFLQCKESEALKKGVEEFLRDNAVDRSTVLLLLRGTAAGNSYFESNLRSGFLGVVKSDKELRSRTMRLIIDEQPPNTVNPPIIGGQPITGPTPAGPKNGQPEGPTSNAGNTSNPGPLTPEPPKPAPIDKRRFREVRSTAITYIDNGNYAVANTIVHDFLSEMHEKGIHDFDKDLESILSRIPKPSDGPMYPVQPGPEPGPPTPKDRQAFRMAKLTARTHKMNGKIKEAVAELQDFKGKMNAKGVTEFDAELDSLINEYTRTDGPPPSGGNGSKAPKGGVAPDAIDNREFRIAKVTAKTHKMNGKIKEAVACLGDFKGKMNAKGVTEFDPELESLIEKYKGDGKTKPEPKPAGGKATPVKETNCTPRDERDFRELQKLVDSKLDLGETSIAKTMVSRFKTKMHARGIHYFDLDIKALEDKIIKSRK